MASNKELGEQAVALGTLLGVTVDVTGLNNSGLATLVAELEAKKAALEPPAPVVASGETPVVTEGTTPAAGALVPPSPPPPAPVDGAALDTQGGRPDPDARLTPRYPYIVAEGKAVTTKRGQIGAFQQVKASDFPGGQETLDGLVKSGFVVKG